MKDGFIKVAAATPEIKVADCSQNTQAIIAQIEKAAQKGASLISFPELCITGYTCSDLFLQRTLLDSAEQALTQIADKTSALDIVSVVGLPVRYANALYNCAAVLYHGEIMGLVPKKNIPVYSEFYESRHFSAGEDAAEAVICGRKVELNPNLLFRCKSLPDFVLGVEVCEDLWVPSSPSNNLAENGATVLVNLSASSETIGKPQYRRMLVQMQSAKLACAYLFADAGFGESTTDLIFTGHDLIAENGVVLTESKRYETGIAYADIDLQRLSGERRRLTTFPSKHESKFKTVEFELPLKETKLTRKFDKNPFVPSSKSEIDQRCMEILMIQETGLWTRLKHTGIKKAVLGLSGGLDSTLALIVTVRAFDLLKLDRKSITAVTMPCFGTTKRTMSNAQLLAEAYGVNFRD